MSVLPTTSTTLSAPIGASALPASGPANLWRAAVVPGAVAALATVLVAAVARRAGIPLAIAGEPIPLNGFAVATLAGALVGTVLAVALRRWARRPRRAFAATTALLTVLSLVPDLLVDATTGSRAVLMLTHLVAALILIPALAARLPRD